MQPYYNLPQAPGKYQNAVIKGDAVADYIYEDVERERNTSNGYVCGVALIPFAYLVCIYMIVEGLVIILHDPVLQPVTTGPFSGSETGYLLLVAWGDVAAALIGAVGVWFSHNLLPIGWRSTSKMHSTIATVGAGTLLAWRCLVCLSFAPWAGIWLAFSPPEADKAWMYVLICLYLAWSIFVVYVLTMAFRQAVSDGKRFQQHVDSQALQERQQLLTDARVARQSNFYADGEAMHDHEVEPELFGCLPLAETVTLYAMVIAGACVWSFIHLVVTDHTSGGWAFFSYTPKVSTTWWLEVFLYPLSFLCALIGLAGASSLCGSAFLPQKPAVASVLIFLLGSLLRFALLFAVTGMDMLEKDTCGFYIHGLANLAYKSPFAPASGFWLHCQPIEYLFLAGVLLCTVLDGYMIWATFQLWHHAQDWVLLHPGKGGDYGAAPGLEEDYEGY